MYCQNRENLSGFQNLETGSGRGDFGQRFFPECLLTDVNPAYTRSPFKVHCLFDATVFPFFWRENTFDKVIMCNPYYYGFDDPFDESQRLIAELHRIVRPEGEILVYGSDSNKFCGSWNIGKTVEIFNDPHRRIAYACEAYDPDDYDDYPFQKDTGGQTVVKCVHKLGVIK